MKRFLLTALTLAFITVTSNAFDGDKVTQGSLEAFSKDAALGKVPLKRTTVNADVSGFLTRVTVVQEFENDFGRAIEAVYVFPLSHDGAVDRMTMKIGSRTIQGVIKKREEARKTYEAARQAGQTAALLDQERPNIFTQSVANILPGEKIIIEISYVETLKYEDGAYEFVFPMVVGPRYNPGTSTGTRRGGGTSFDTTQVPDASRISPNISPTRTGSDISINVNLNAGVPVENISSKLHEIDSQQLSSNSATIKLRNENEIPNKDFILRYDVTGKRIEDAVLVHRSGRGGFFSMIIQPPDDMSVEDMTPKEIVFVLDTSGSMRGFPLDKAKEAMKLSLKGLHPRDTFNIVTFAGSTSVLFDAPVPATKGNLDMAHAFIDERRGGGGTEMMKAIQTALKPSGSQEHLRIVCFMTDGYVSNDMKIIGEIENHPNARVFSFGIGNSVNRYLLENMAVAGKGEAEIITLASESQKAAERFYKRVRTPLLTDLSIDWNGLEVEDIYPSKLTDLFTAKPVVINGRYKFPQSGSIKLKGKIAGQNYEREIKVEFAETEARNDVLGTLWARRKVSELMSKDMEGIQNRNGEEDIEQQITSIGLEFGILTQFTSFVAVEDGVSNPARKPTIVDVPVENPEGHNQKITTVVNTQDASIGNNFVPRQITNLPTNARNVNELLKLQPGVTREGYVAGGKSDQSKVTLSGGGSGSGSGSGSGIGNGRAAKSHAIQRKAAATPSTAVTVSTGNAATVDTTSTRIDSNITVEVTKALPNGTSFSSLLKTAPNVSPSALGGGFQVDGASASENGFVIDGQQITNYRTAVGKDDPTTSLVELKRPTIPQAAKWSEADAIVKVDFSVDETGAVIKAKAMTGNRNLKKPSEVAAMGSKFTAPVIEGDKMPMNGRIAYKFVDRENVEITLESMNVELTPAKRRQLTKKYKLHFWIFALVERLDRGSDEPSEFETKFVQNGVADIRVLLNDGVKDGEAVLKKAGLKIYKSNGSLVYGRIKIGKLYDLAVLNEVKYVTP